MRPARIRHQTSCELRCNLHVTGVVADRYDLYLPFPTLYPGKQPHPREDLRHRSRQDKAVGDIMIATRTQLELEPSPFQSTHAPSNRTVSCSAALVHRWAVVSRYGSRKLWLPSAVRTCIAFWR